MELEETVLIASASLATLGCVGLLCGAYKMRGILNSMRIDMTKFLDDYIVYATPRLKTRADYQAIIDLGKTRAETGL